MQGTSMLLVIRRSSLTHCASPPADCHAHLNVMLMNMIGEKLTIFSSLGQELKGVSAS